MTAQVIRIQRMLPPPDPQLADQEWRHACWMFLRAAFNGAPPIILKELAREQWLLRDRSGGVWML